MRRSVSLGVSGLMGAAGVILAAAAAHAKPGTGLDSAAQMLLIHALAIMGVVAIDQGGGLRKPGATVAIWAWALGGAMFAGDIAIRAFASTRLFPMAAPMGGILLIGGWLIFAAAASLARR